MTEQISLQSLFSGRIDVKKEDDKQFTLKIVHSKRRPEGYAIVVHNRHVGRNVEVIETIKRKVISRFDATLKYYNKSNTVVIDKLGIIDELKTEINERHEETTNN